MAQEKIKQTAGRGQLEEFAPKFAELNDDVLFGEVWSRTDKLGLRDRSLATITSLIWPSRSLDMKHELFTSIRELIYTLFYDIFIIKIKIQ